MPNQIADIGQIVPTLVVLTHIHWEIQKPTSEIPLRAEMVIAVLDQDVISLILVIILTVQVLW